MIKRFFLAFMFCLVAFSAKAEEKSFENFSIDLISDWQLMGEPVNEAGTEVVIFVNTEKGAAVLVTFAPSGGQKLNALAEQSEQMMKAQGIELKMAGASDKIVVFEGNQGGADIKMFITADPEAGQMGTMVYSGNIDAAAEIGKTVVSKNTKLLFRE